MQKRAPEGTRSGAIYGVRSPSRVVRVSAALADFFRTATAHLRPFWVATTLAASLLILLPAIAGAQVKRHGYVVGQARELMTRDWLADPQSATERAYCIVSDTTIKAPDGVWITVVKAAIPALTFAADSFRVSFRCPRGAKPAHTHPGGLGSYIAHDCTPSQADRAMVRERRFAYGIIQCDASAFTFHFAEPPDQRRLSAGAYASLLAGGLGSNLILQWDLDRGRYEDSYQTPDKLSHLLAGYAIASTAAWMGVDPTVAFFGACIAAAGWEYSQAVDGGYFSNRDLVASCTGALMAFGVERLVRR